MQIVFILSGVIVQNLSMPGHEIQLKLEVSVTFYFIFSILTTEHKSPGSKIHVMSVTH